MITNYIPNTCGYGLNNLKKVVHIFSESANVIHIDNGEAYVTSGITDLQTISATSVSFEETTAYDDRFKFQKTVTATVNGFSKLSALGGKYYVVLEDVNGIMWLVNVDFPSLVTYTYTLQDGTDETVFTFSALSNFPTLKLNASINNAYACQNYSLVRVDEIKMLEKRYANINASSGIVYGYSNQVYKTVRPYRNSIKVEETFDGTNANTTIQFSIGLDDYQSSWHYNMLEYPYNKYVAVIDHLACGFEMGLVPSYNVQGSHQIGGGDTVTVTLVGGSQRGSEWAELWLEVTIPPQYTWKLSDEWDCQTIEYRWTESGTTCIGYDKYQNNILELSIDGENWEVVEPAEYSASTLIQRDSEDCGYIPPFEGKLRLALKDGSIIDTECDSTSSVTKNEISAYRPNVTSAVIGDCVTSIDNEAFYNCTGLTSINIPNGVTSIGKQAFYDCKNLSNVKISNSVTSISTGTFINCQHLIAIDIPNSVTSIGDSAFYSCPRLAAIRIPSGVTRIDDWVFYGCSNLFSVRIEAVTPPAADWYYGKAFDNTNDCPIYVPCESIEAYKTASGWSEYASRFQCIDDTLPMKYKVTLDNGCVITAACDSTSEVTSGEMRTRYEYALTSVEIGDCVTTIGYTAFMGCSNLKNVLIPNTVTTIGAYAFQGTGITALTLPESVTTIGNNAFSRNNDRIFMLTVKATTPPTLGSLAFVYTRNFWIYVPPQSIEAYKSASEWKYCADRIYPIPT